MAADYSNNFGTATFDDFSLRLEPVQTYKYDSNGNLIRTTQTENAPESYTYSGADLTKYISGGNGTFTYTYDSKHNLTSATNDTVKMTLTNNAQGLTTSVTLADKTGSLGKTLQSSAGYSSDFRFQTSSTDVNGSTSSAEYDALGNRTAATAPNGTKTNYNYTLGTTAAATDNRLRQSYISGKISLNYTYANGALTAARRGHYAGSTNLTQTYSFAYDSFLNPTSLKVGSNTLATYEYAAGNGQMRQVTFGNGCRIEYRYDMFDRLVQEKFFRGNSLTQTKVYLYNGEGELAETALYNGEVSAANEQQRYRYEYDSLGRVICSQEIANGALRQGTETLYDDANRVKKQSWSLFQTEDGKTTTKTYTGRYTYNTGNGTMSTADFGTGRTATFAYDNLQRLTSETMAGLYTKSYTYRDISSTRTTTQIASESYTGLCSGWLNRSASYTYDAMGNIATITGPYKNKNSVQRTYTYDAQNQLLSEKIGSDTTSYTYDTVGNIRSITGPGVTKTFSYNDSGDWKDLLTSVTVNGTTRSITYEEENGVTIGNPLSYFNGTQYTLAWQNGRQLQSLSGGGKSATYSYGADGIRTGKTVTDASGTTTYQYTTQNGQIARQSWSAGGTAYQMDFIYDAAGRPLSMYYRTKTASQTDFNGDSYYYETNQQGDVTGLYKITYDAATKSLSATRVASYEYDAWGNVTYSTGEMADINPLRYRGYYQDWESGYYYLQSRYYDPVIGRFINADGQISLDGSFLNTNQFVYCGNNPVNQVDPEGKFWKKIGSFFKKIGKSISKFARKKFGAWSSTYATISKTKIQYLPDPLPITFETGTIITQTIAKLGDTSKPISVYAKINADDSLMSSVGARVGGNSNALNFSIGVNNTGIYYSSSNENTTNSFGIKMDLSELKIGFESSTAITWDTTTETTYSNCSISFWAIAAGYILITTGQLMPTPAYA